MNTRALMALVDETRALFQRLKAVAEETHEQGEASGGLRSVLFMLENGPQTVVQMANSRPVSRQHIQKLVNALLKQRLVETAPNPAHRRSYLVRLTPVGRRMAREMRRREAELLQSAKIGRTTAEINQAAGVLRSVREFFESPEWQKHLQGGRT